MKKALVPLLVTGVLLTACSGGSVAGPTPDSVSPLPTPGTASTSVPPVDIPTSTPTPSTLPSVSPAPAAILVLQPDGLSAVGSSAMLIFGKADQQTVRTVLTSTITGSVMSSQVQCPQGQRSQIVVDGFAALFDSSGRFVGWTENGSAERDLTTANGIGLRSTVQDLKQAFAKVTVAGSSFTAGSGLSGTLDNQQQVTTLSGGQTCPTT